MASRVNTMTSNNPLYDKMCDKFQFHGNVTVAEMMLKKAAHHQPIHRQKPAHVNRHANAPLQMGNVRRYALVCCSVFLLTVVLVVCAVFSTSKNDSITKINGIFAEESETDIRPVDDYPLDLIPLSDDYYAEIVSFEDEETH